MSLRNQNHSSDRVKTQTWDAWHRDMNAAASTPPRRGEVQQVECPREDALSVAPAAIYGEISLSDEYLKVVAGMHSLLTFRKLSYSHFKSVVSVHPAHTRRDTFEDNAINPEK